MDPTESDSPDPGPTAPDQSQATPDQSQATPDQSQAVILRAVWQVVAERGMEGVSMRTVAAAAGVSVGRLQYRFGTKEELLRAGLAAMLSGAAGLHADATEGIGDRATLWELISHPIPRSEHSKVGVAVFHQYVAAGVNRPELARLLAEAKQGGEREAARLIRRIAPHVVGPRTVARTLIATADGLALRVLIGGLSVTAAQRTLRTALDEALD